MKRSRLASAIAALVVAIGAKLTVPYRPLAQRISEKAIKSECWAAGGSYSTQTYGSASSGTYTDIDGDSWTDYYLDGEYEGAEPGRRR